MEIDLPYISTYLNLPEPFLTTLLISPTVELVKSLLISVASKAREHEQLQSEKLRLDVDFESVVRAGESKARVLRESVEKGLREAEELRKKLQEEGMSTGYRIESSLLNQIFRVFATKIGVGSPGPQILFLVFDL
jgi:hypothetical protein